MDPFQYGPPLTFGGQGQQATPFGMQMPASLTLAYGGGGMGMGVAPGGGWLGALGRRSGWGDMSGLERAYMLTSIGGGVFDALERRGMRKEEQRRYEQALEESRRHREAMGRNLNRAWGPR